MAKLRYEVPVDYNKLDWVQRRSIREQYARDQGMVCFYCKDSLCYLPSDEILVKAIDHSLFPPNFFDHPIHLQHDHDTGLTEGAVHAYCNAVMWQYEGR